MVCEAITRFSKPAVMALVGACHLSVNNIKHHVGVWFVLMANDMVQ